MTNERFIELYDKRKLGSLSEAEANELNEWIEKSEQNRRAFERLINEKVLKNKLHQLSKAKQDDWRYILEKLPELESSHTPVQVSSGKRMPVRRLAIALAASLLLFMSGIYIWTIVRDKFKTSVQAKAASGQIKTDIAAPDVTKATITLANGTVVGVDSVSSGILALQGNTQLSKSENGEIVYYNDVPTKEDLLQYNIIKNPNGSRLVTVTLSDNTRVWLNSGSQLKYPVSFGPGSRMVELDGEAYFEVANSANKKFIVQSGSVATEVLGTHFNVKSFSDEDEARVTLLEGSVKVSGNGKSMLLKPGDQAVAGKNASLQYRRILDFAEVLDWKNGDFYFKEENIKNIMSKLARWYDVEIVYETPVVEKKYSGIISRNKKLSEVLKVLELSDVHFSIEGKRIVVMQ